MTPQEIEKAAENHLLRMDLPLGPPVLRVIELSYIAGAEMVMERVKVLEEALDLLLSNTRLALINDKEAESNIQKARAALEGK